MVQVVRGRGLTKRFQVGSQVVHALRGVDITVEQGEAVAIIGASGSGKSTLMGLLGGLDSPTEGELEIAGVPITNMGENQLAEIRNQYIGFVFQQINLLPTLTSTENVALPVQFSSQKKFDPKRRAVELLTNFGLADRLNSRPNQLSGGEQQRVAVARALANDPLLLLCDEPTGSLDTENGDRVMDTLFQAREMLGTAVVIVTHDPRVSARADRVLVLTDGQFVDGASAAS